VSDAGSRCPTGPVLVSEMLEDILETEQTFGQFAMLNIRQ